MPVPPAGAPLTRGRAAWLLVLLTLANVINFYDRTIPAVIVEPIKDEFGLSDTAIGLLGGSFTIVYAVAGIAIGRLADRMTRRWIIAAGLLVWSLFTLGGGLAHSFLVLACFRLGVGIGEASYGPASSSLIFDAFPPRRRSRAVSITQLGIPIGMLMAFVTVGLIVEAYDSWRAPFVIAAIPGIALALLMLTLPEPVRGGADSERVDLVSAAQADDHPFRRILSVPTVRWLMVAGIGLQMPNYAVATFAVPLLQRYFGLSLQTASLGAGIVIGIAGMVGLLLGGVIADRAAHRSVGHRMGVVALGFAIALPVSTGALLFGPHAAVPFIAVFAAGWTCTQVLSVAAAPAIADVTPPHMRATALAIYYASFNVVGATIGPVLTGALSDALATASGGLSADAVGLHRALLVIVPLGLAIATYGSWRAARALPADHARMTLPASIS